MFKRIKVPKFKMGRYTLNEYELRNLMLEVAQGHKPEYIDRKVSEGDYVAYIQEDGSLNGRLPGLSVASHIAIDHMKIKNQKYKLSNPNFKYEQQNSTTN
jgi:hypothetical protein